MTSYFKIFLKRLEQQFFISVAHDLSRGLHISQLNNLTVSTVFDVPVFKRLTLVKW